MPRRCRRSRVVPRQPAGVFFHSYAQSCAVVSPGPRRQCTSESRRRNSMSWWTTSGCRSRDLLTDGRSGTCTSLMLVSMSFRTREASPSSTLGVIDDQDQAPLRPGVQGPHRKGPEVLAPPRLQSCTTATSPLRTLYCNMTTIWNVPVEPWTGLLIPVPPAPGKHRHALAYVCELPASRFCRHALWRPKRRLDLTPRLARQVFREITC
jgi:hypothetical protein